MNKKAMMSILTGASALSAPALASSHAEGPKTMRTLAVSDVAPSVDPADETSTPSDPAPETEPEKASSTAETGLACSTNGTTGGGGGVVFGVALAAAATAARSRRRR